MNLLIIGGTGVLSSAVAVEATTQGISVTMINRGRRKISENVEAVKADKDDIETISRALEGRTFDAVMDFLCYTDEQTERSARFYSQYTKQYFFISSCAVYDTGSLKGQMATEESKKVLPIWKYSVNKWASEQKLVAILSNTGVSYTIVRPCVTYGDTRIPYGIMPAYGYHWTLCARILAGKPVIIWNNGKNRCNMTHVKDFAVGVVGLIGNPKAYNQTFNVCGNEAPTFKEVLNTVGKLLNKEVITVNISPQFYAKEFPSKAGEILGGRSIDTINSNQKLIDAVPQFKQTITLKRGIAMTLNAYKTQGYQQGIDWSFDAETDRIIKTWLKKDGQSLSNYCLGFVDYLGTADFKNKMAYWLTAHKNNPIIRALLIGAKRTSII